MRFRRRRQPDPEVVLERVPDDLPRAGLFAEPVAVTRLVALEPERLDDGRVRVAFRATVKDAEGRRCPDLAVEARVTGPERTSAGTGNTDLMGAVTFRMAGPPGTYTLEVLDVAAGGLRFDADASVSTVATTVS